MSEFFEGIFGFIIGIPFMFIMGFGIVFCYIMFKITGDDKWLQSPMEKPQ